MTGKVLRNWGHTAVSRPERVFVPADLDALRAIVREAARQGRRIRPMGHRHSVNQSIEVDGGIQVDMSRYRAGDVRVEADPLDPDARVVTAGAGTTLLQLRNVLRAHGLELAMSPEIGNATVGSVACAGTKDASFARRTPGVGQISSLVRRLGVVDASGEPRVIEGAQLHVYRSSYGLMGIVHEVTFATVKRQVQSVEYEWLDLSGKIPDVDRVLGRAPGQKADGILAFLDPYGKRMLVERRTLLGLDATPPSPKDNLKRSIRDWIWEWGQTEAVLKALQMPGVAQAVSALGPALPEETSPEVVEMLRRGLDAVLEQVAARRLEGGVPAALDMIASLTAPLLTTVPWTPRLPLLDVGPRSAYAPVDVVNRAPVMEIIGGYHAYRSDSMIDFRPDRYPVVFDFTFWAFPRLRWATIVEDYLKFCEEFLERTRYRTTIYTEVYFIDRDPSSLLSFSPDGPVFTLDMVDMPRPAGGDTRWDERWCEMNRRFNRWATVEKDTTGQTRGGRPILNQTKRLEDTPEVLEKAFGSRWTDFVDAVRQADPHGRFRSTYFDALGLHS
jgi:FAD/FMN-containing dehydrogenase